MIKKNIGPCGVIASIRYHLIVVGQKLQKRAGRGCQSYLDQTVDEIDDCAQIKKLTELTNRLSTQPIFGEPPEE
jgi:hypothetical protein